MGHFQEYSSRQKNTEEPGVDRLDSNGKQIQICVGSVKGQNAHESCFMELLSQHSADGRPALLCAQLPDQDTRGERNSPPGEGQGGSQALSQKILEEMSCSNQYLHRGEKAPTLTSDRFGFKFRSRHLMLDRLFISGCSISLPLKLEECWGTHSMATIVNNAVLQI